MVTQVVMVKTMATQAEIETAYRELMDADVINRETVEYALIAAERARWQPIETAPKTDQPLIFAAIEGKILSRFLLDSTLEAVRKVLKPTVVQPLLSPPENK